YSQLGQRHLNHWNSRQHGAHYSGKIGLHILFSLGFTCCLRFFRRRSNSMGRRLTLGKNDLCIHSLLLSHHLKALVGLCYSVHNGLFDLTRLVFTFDNLRTRDRENSQVFGKYTPDNLGHNNSLIVEGSIPYIPRISGSRVIQSKGERETDVLRIFQCNILIACDQIFETRAIPWKNAVVVTYGNPLYGRAHERSRLMADILSQLMEPPFLREFKRGK
ncbi:hypothetical protein WG66_008379, partial [Moniliophthora roreri]